MSTEVQVLKDTQQSDYAEGCVEIRADGPRECFMLGLLFQHLVLDSKKAVTGERGNLIFVRIPLVAVNSDIRPGFLRAMQKEIDANSYKGPWNDFAISREYAEVWLREHVEKLIQAIQSGRDAVVTEHCADIANIAMKIEEAYGVQS